MGYIRLYVAISIAPHASTIPKTSGTVRRSPSHRTAPFENWRISAADETLAQRTSVRPEPPLLSCVRPAPDLVAASLTRWTNSTSDSCSSAEAPSPDGCRRASLGHQCGHLLSRCDANLARLNERPAQRGKRACGLPRFAGAQLTPSTTERHRPRRAPGPPFGYFVRGQHVALHLADEDLRTSLCS